MPFDYDVFISYAHIDNATLQKGQEGWIDMLHKALELRLGRVVAMICPRRATLMLAVVLLALSNVSVANAQFPVQPLGRLTCVTTFVPNLLRAENLAARTADSRLDCTNDGVFNPFTPNNITQYVLMNVNLTLNTAVTNMLAGGAGRCAGRRQREQRLEPTGRVAVARRWLWVYPRYGWGSVPGAGPALSVSAEGLHLGAVDADLERDSVPGAGRAE